MDEGYQYVRWINVIGLKAIYSGPASYDRLDIRTTWVTTKILVLTYDQSLELRPACRTRPKRAVVNKDPRCVRKLQSEPVDQQSVQQISSSKIKEILKKWTELQMFVEKTHPDREKANRCIHLLNDNVMSYYRRVLKKKQKQTTLDQFLVPKRLRPSDPEAGPSGLQTLPKRERTPESQLLFLVGFLWEFRNAL